MTEHTRALLIMRERYMEQAKHSTFKFVSNEQIEMSAEQLEKLIKYVAGCMASAAVDVLKSGV